MLTSPIPLATYLASLTMNFYDVANVRATGDAVIQVAGGNGSVSIPVAQGVQGFSMYAGATLPTATAPAGAVPMDKYTLTAADGAGLPGDVYRKNGDTTWALIGSIRGAAGHPVFVGTTVPTSTVPAGATTGDQYLYLGTSVGNPGDVYVKASDGSWSVSGSQRGPAGPSGAAQMQDRGAWAASTAYVSGDVVTQGTQRWLTKTAHTSGSTFSGATNWIPLTPPVAYTLSGVMLMNLATSYALTNNFEFPVQWNTQVSNAGSGLSWSGSTPANIVVSKAGLLRVTASVATDGTGGSRQIRAQKNGTINYNGSSGPSAGTFPTTSLTTNLIPVAAGDNVTVTTYQNSGGNINVLNASGSFELLT